MNLPFVFVTLFQVVLTQAPDEIIKYVGDNVTLSSGGKSSLFRIVWSIFSNTTIIAMYQSKTSTELFPQYSKRLSLDESTGDLTIHNLKTQDSLVYKVELLNPQGVFERSINLSVRQRLPEPTIEVVFSTLTEGSRLLWLKCSSTEEGVVFTWKATARLLNISRSGELVAAYDSLQGPAEFTCITTRDNETTSSLYQDLIEEDPSPGPCQHCRDRCSICVVLVILAAVVIFLLYFSLCCKKKYDQRKNETPAPSA